MPKHSTSNPKIEKDCWLRPIPRALLPELFWVINPNGAGGTSDTPLSACRSAVSSPEVITHQEGIIPRTAGSASSLGFRSKKPIRQLNSNNDPPLNTLREEQEEEIVQESRSSCWQCLWKHWSLSSVHWTVVKTLPPRPPQRHLDVGTASVQTVVCVWFWPWEGRETWVWIGILPLICSMVWQHFKISPSLSFLVYKIKLIPTQELLKGSNATESEKHKLGPSLYGERERCGAKNETMNAILKIILFPGHSSQNVCLYL